MPPRPNQFGGSRLSAEEGSALKQREVSFEERMLASFYVGMPAIAVAWHPALFMFPYAKLFANDLHGLLARRLVAVGGRVVFGVAVCQRPLSRHSIREASGLVDAADDQSVLADDVVVVLTVGARPAFRSATEEKVGHRLPRISRNSFGPLRSLRLRLCFCSSVVAGSIRRSNSPSVARAPRAAMQPPRRRAA